MASRRFLRLIWWGGILLMVGMCLAAAAQQAAQKSDASLAREGALALAAAHGEKPRYGGKFLSVGNEEIPTYDMHQTSFGGVYAATAPAYNCLIRTSPYDPQGQEFAPELAESWEVSDGGQTIIFHLHKGAGRVADVHFGLATLQDLGGVTAETKTRNESHGALLLKQTAAWHTWG